MTSRATPLDGIDLVLADLDGVVYAGAGAIPHAIESLNRAGEGRRIGYITNNASRTAASISSHLSALGLQVVADDIVTSPQAGVRMLRALVPEGSTIFVVGGEGITHELERAGFGVTRSADDEPAAVIQGFSPEIGWVHLAEATFALKSGIPWVATNMDWTIPVARGVAPGNGTLVSAVHTAAGRMPVVAGKPEVAMFETAVERFAASRTLVIGDRLDTDILGANRAGLESVLVLTGIDRAKQVLAAVPNQRPTFILDDLRQLHEPYPAVIEDADGSGTRSTRVGDAVVTVAGNVVTAERTGGRTIDLLRAGAVAIWNSGTTIYSLRVDARLYSWQHD